MSLCSACEPIKMWNRMSKFKKLYVYIVSMVESEAEFKEFKPRLKFETRLKIVGST